MQNNKLIKSVIKKITIALTIIFILFIICAISIKNLFSYSLIENNLSNFLGLKIELSNPVTNFDNHLNLVIKSDEINIYDNNKTIKYITIEKLNARFRPVSLLFKKINFKQLEAQNIIINIKKDTNGQINIIKSLKIKNIEKYTKQKPNIVRLNSNIDNIELNFENKYKNDFQSKWTFKNTAIEVSKKHKKLNVSQKGQLELITPTQKEISYINTNISSTYPINNSSSNDLFLDISISKLNLCIFSDIFKKYISNDIKNIAGNIEIAVKTTSNNPKNQKIDINLSNPTLLLKDGSVISPYKNGIKIISLLDINKNSIAVNELNLISNELFIKSSGEIAKYTSKNPEYNFKIDISNTQMNNFLYFIPDNLIYYRPQGIPTLKKSNFHGLIDGSINLKLSPLDITGNIKVSNVHIPNIEKPSCKNDVNAIFMKDKMRIYTRVFTPDSSEYVIIDGVSNLDNSLYGKYSVKSTPKINLSYAQKYLVPIQQIIGFNIGPVPIMDISGYGNIDIKTQGTLKDAQIFGEFNAYSATAKIKGLDAKLINGNCKLIFDNRDLIFKEVKGKLNNANFLLTGKGNTKGEVNLNVTLNNAYTSNVIKILNNSVIGKPYINLTKKIAALSGNSDLNINLKGTISDYESEDLFTSLIPSGLIKFKNNKAILTNKLSAKNINGEFSFGQKQQAELELNVNNTKFLVNMTTKEPIQKIINNNTFEINTMLYSNSINSKDIINELQKASFTNQSLQFLLSNLSDIDFYSKLNLKAITKTNTNNVDFKNTKLYGTLTGLNSQNNKNISFNSGIVKFDDNKIIFNNMDIGFHDGKIKINGNISNILSKPLGNLTAELNNISLEKINTLFPKVKSTNSTIKNGKIIFKNDNIKLSGISIDYSNMPIFLNAQIKNIYSKKNVEAELSTIFNENTLDNIINPYLTSPLKAKGEIPLKCNFSGNSQNYIINFDTSIPKDSDLSFGGANIGDIEYNRKLQGKIEINKNIANISNLKLIKFIENQNKKINPLTSFKIDGQIIQKKEDFYYNNFKIATLSPVNVRILNLIFKKSLLKQGNFECNVNLNGNIKLPKATGKIILQDLDIPLYDTQISDIKINITNNLINGEILAKNKKSDLKVTLKALNKTEIPYIVEKINITSTKLNIKDILTSMPVQAAKTDINKRQDIIIKPEDIIIKNGSFDFKDVSWDKVNAQNLSGNFNFENNIFNLKNTNLNIANGQVNMDGTYSTKSTRLNLTAQMNECDANTLADEFLNLPNQIFGKMNGYTKLSAKNINSPEGIKNFTSDIDFSINDGKMPKLGSLEYLLRAGNLIKSGIIGLSLNNLIQVLTPYKTGEFEQISGNLHIENGKVENLEILSKGKNLSLYLNGSYDILDKFADIKIYGKLSQNISNALGALGNASLKQFFDIINSKKSNSNRSEELQKNLDKIPTIETENTEPRYFKVNALGDINKENYIKSFKWL